MPTTGGGAGSGPAVVAFGGGHGLSASLGALRLMSDRLTAIVTVADDGGSSGRLRDEMGVLPPGDLRMALAALCDDTDLGRQWREVLQHRFTTGGPMDDHALGNLLIVAVWDVLEDAVSGMDMVGRLVGARGRVLPMSSVPLEIEADIFGEADSTLRTVGGQAAVAAARGNVRRVRLVPGDAPTPPEAVAAIEAADWVVLGPGSWFTSVMPHLLVPQLAAAIHRTGARRAVTLNLTDPPARRTGMTTHQHVRALREHAPGLRVDVVIADPSSVDDVDVLREQVAEMGASLLVREVRVGDGTLRHDALRLAAAYRDAFEQVQRGVRDCTR